MSGYSSSPSAKEIFLTSGAGDFTDGFLLGDGRLAASVYGVGEDIVTINHERLWTGQNRDKDTEYVADKLPQLKRLLKEKRFSEATAYANRYWAGAGGISGKPNRVDPYVPLCELVFKASGQTSAQPESQPEFVSRRLELMRGYCETLRRIEGAFIKSECFVDCVASKFLLRISCDSAFCGTLFLRRDKDERMQSEITDYSNSAVRYRGRYRGGNGFEFAASVFTDGRVSCGRGGLTIENATYIVLAGDADAGERLSRPLWGNAPDFDAALLMHCRRFSAFTARTELSLGGDNAQTERYFNLGKYLLVAGSINAELPLNLQGKWNGLLEPPWKCDYHFDINLQMNYWCLESLNLGDLFAPLESFLLALTQHGRKAARDLYNARGFLLPLQNDASLKCTPESYGWAVWLGAGAWMAQHLYWHYLYSGDRQYLARVFPYFEGLADFYDDILTEDEKGEYQIMPSQSPENKFTDDEFPVTVCTSSAIDVQLAYDALSYAIECAPLAIKAFDKDKLAHWRRLRALLPAFKIGTDGRLMEWAEQYAEAEPAHRHLSHLYGVYPAQIFTPLKNPDCYRAAKLSLDKRLAVGGGHTGWSRAWCAALYARLGEGEQLFHHLERLICDYSSRSLLDLHPMKGTRGVFQIDGNLGGTAAIVEALVCCRDGRIEICPALPKAWDSGFIKGVKTFGGHVLNLYWQNGRAQKVEITFGYESKAVFFYDNKTYFIERLSAEPQTLWF